jgi:hypothetical protein
MVTKTNRPSLKVDENDLLPQRKALSSDDEEDSRILAAADQLSARHSALRDGSPPIAALPRPAPAPVPTIMASWKLVVPDYLDRELSRSAAERRVSKGFLVLEA